MSRTARGRRRRANVREEVEGLPYEDSLYVLRPAIEDSPYNEDYGHLGEMSMYHLLSAVRDAGERIAAAGPSAVVRLVEILETKRNGTFDRLALHLLRNFSDTPGAPGLIAERLKGKLASPFPGLFHEYALLLRDRFEDLSAEDRAEILRSINEGPPQEELESMSRHRTPDDFSDEPLTNEELDAYLTGYAERWKLRRYAILDDLLPEAEWAEYERLAAKHEDLLEGDPLFYGEPSVRQIVPRGSPWSADDMKTMQVAEIVSFLRDFEPGDGWEEPDSWDVGHVLTSVVASDPARFGAEADGFRGVGPTFVNALLRGLHEALRKQDDGEGQARDGNPSFPWRPVLALCRWVLDQPRNASEEQYVRGRDVGWAPTLSQAASLLRDGLLKSGELPFGFRTHVWDVLERLAEDPEPNKEYEEEAAKRGRPPLTPNHFSINTVRGVAMHAILAYALWVYRNLAEDETGGADNTRERWRDFDDIPEVREVLDRHLDPVAEPTRTVRSVYGTWLPSLVYLDRRWVEEKLLEIFPRDEAHAYLCDAVWDTYLVHSRSPCGEDFELLREEYARAVEQLAERHATEGGEERRPDPDRSLAEHLMILYWRSTLGFGEPDSLLERFYALASDELRAHAAGFVGRVLAKQAAAPDALARLEKLWERRLESAEEGGENMAGELGAFGWWFLSGKFDDELALSQLDRSLVLGGDVGRDAYSVVKRLAAVAPQHPRLAVGCLDKIVRKILAGSPDSRWGILAIEDNAIQVLLAPRSGDQETHQTVQELANVLIANAYPRFETLL